MAVWADVIEQSARKRDRPTASQSGIPPAASGATKLSCPPNRHEEQDEPQRHHCTHDLGLMKPKPRQEKQNEASWNPTKEKEEG